jgi:[acyl-carrier-protein] S-malonyltransferase
MKFAITFPGQGSQYVGMGSDLVSLPTAKRLFSQADDILQMNLSRICWEGPLETLSRTDVSQPAIFVHALACVECYAEYHAEIFSHAYATCGLSLGEYTALVFAGVLDFTEALRLVKLRGELMQKACDLRPGGMLAVIGLTVGRVTEIIAPLQERYPLGIANINAPDQIVVAGAKEILEETAACLRKANAKILPLKVAGAFHSVLMQSAQEKLAEELARAHLRAPRIPIVANTTARYVADAEEIRRVLIAQVTAPVLWSDSLELLFREGVDTFYEMGPGNQLTGLLKRNVPQAKGICVGKLENIH